LSTKETTATPSAPVYHRSGTLACLAAFKTETFAHIAAAAVFNLTRAALSTFGQQKAKFHQFISSV
jgi:hypothetical protein